MQCLHPQRLVFVGAIGFRHAPFKLMSVKKAGQSPIADLLCALQIYLLLLFLRVLLSWFPAFNWERQPWLGLRQVWSSTHRDQ